MTSKSPTAPPVARTPRGVGGADDGFTLVAAVAVALIGMLLATTAVTVALRSDSSAAQDRGRTQALAAAEAGLDAAVLAAQRGTYTCGPTITPVWSSPGSSSVTVTSAFYPETGAPLCTVPAGTTIVRAEVRSTATHTHNGRTARRTLTATVTPAASSIPGSGYAVFGQSVTGGSSSDTTIGGEIYVSQGDFTCNSSGTALGQVTVAKGRALLSSSCQVTGAVRAANGVRLSTSAVVQGNAFSWNGNISAATSSELRGNAETRGGTITTESSGTISGSRNTASTQAPPVAVEVPRITYQPADWQAAGFTVSPWSSLCSTVPSFTTTLPATTPALYDTRMVCPLGLNGSSSARLRVQADTALFVNRFTGDSSFRIESVGGQPRKVWIIVPAAATGDYCAGSPSGPVSLSTSFTTGPGVSLFVYAACDADVASSAAWRGQLWGRNLTQGSSQSLTYSPVGVPGVTVRGQTLAAGEVAKVEVVS
jgi:type II secretory pathway pseudopilin PulG